MDNDKIPQPDESPRPEQDQKPKKRHLIKPAWLRIPLKALLWVVLAVVFLFVAVYIPPVQTGLKNLASGIVRKSTGMDVKIDKFRLRFPLDVSLQGVSVVEATGDTMVRAREVIADVKLLPLLALDVKVNKLRLLDGYYRMVSPDSSMILKLNAGELVADDRTSFDIGKMRLLINDAKLRDADVRLFMDVWKQKPNNDTTATPFYLQANRLKIENIRFAMSMLPTIDTLDLRAASINLDSGIIDLASNKIKIKYAGVDRGDVTYLTPTPEYIASHPVPVDTTAVPSKPMVIEADSLSLTNFAALYAVKGAKPLPGFDPSYIYAAGINIGLKDFFNMASTVRLPITSITATERSGLQILRGSGTIGVDESGLTLSDMNIATPYSTISATAGIPFALMELKPEAPLNANVKASLGMHDIYAFMPDLSKMLSAIPNTTALNANLEAKGTLASVDIPVLDVALPGILSLQASGWVDNLLDIKKLGADIDFNGRLTNPDVVDRLAGGTGFKIPQLTISGTARAKNQNYFADIDLKTTSGNLVALGNVNLNSENYSAKLDIAGLRVADFLPDLGIGTVNASLVASGDGFNPTLPHAATDIDLRIHNIEYNDHVYSDITLNGYLADGRFDVDLHSPDPIANLDLKGSGSIAPDFYEFDVVARIVHLDLHGIGLTPEMNNGNADIAIKGTAQPGKWLYNVDLVADNVDWNMPDTYIHLPEGVHARFIADEDHVDCNVDSDLTNLAFTSPLNLKDVVDGFMAVMPLVDKQIKDEYLSVAAIAQAMPHFNLDLGASGRGLLRHFLAPSGLDFDTISGNISNQDFIEGNIALLGLTEGSLQLDTITLALKQRDDLLDYRLHLGNAPGTLDEFAQVGVNGYIGGNRASLSLTQKNIQGQTGYRLGLTAALQDSTVSVHFTPLKSTIAYMPWSFNADNYIDYSFDRRIEANLLAKSRESSILLETTPNDDGDIQLHLALTNIHIEDFLQMSVLAPPIKGAINSDMNIVYKGDAVIGNGSLGVTDLSYAKQRIGNFDFLFDAGLNFNGDTEATASLLIDNHKALIAHGTIHSNPEEGQSANDFGVTLNKFPLEIANPFLGRDVAQLHGALNGEMSMQGDFTAPVLNGSISCDSVRVFIPMMGSSVRFSDTPLTVENNLVHFNSFKIYGANENPLVIVGDIDATRFNNVRFDVGINGNNFQLIGNDKRAKSDIYGKIFLTLAASAKGSLKFMDINANLNILKNTDVYYTIPTAQAQLSQVGSGEDVVKFVQFNDTTQVQKADSISSIMNMRIAATATISSGTRVCVNLSSSGADKVELNPYGTLVYRQNFMGDMTLNGQLHLGSGTARYNVPVIGEKKFTIDPSSYVTFNGNILNPTLNLKATNDVKTSVTQASGNSSLVNFLVTLSVTNTLSSPNVLFDLSTNDDISIQNELQSMSADQRSNQAMNLLLYGQYTGPGSKSSSSFNSSNMLYSFLTSSLNSWAASHIRGVDLSFGIDQYDQTRNGQKQSTTSYSYQVSKSLFDNRFKIIVGGNYSTDASADENFSQNLINDISFEYMLRQTNNMSMYLKLFRHTGFESILEGDVTETGVGFVMRRRISSIKQFFNFRFGRRRRQTTEPEAADTTVVTPETHNVNPVNISQP